MKALRWYATSRCSAESYCHRYSAKVTTAGDLFRGRGWSEPPREQRNTVAPFEIANMLKDNLAEALATAKQICEEHAKKAASSVQPSGATTC